jgi:putative membrane protein
MLNTLPLVFIGILLGTFTGLTPAIHVNTIVILILSSLPILLEFLTVYEIIAIIISMAVMHTFVDFIPAMLLGAPHEDSVLSVLPGHKLLLEGRGYEAIRLTVIGGLGAALLSCAVLPIGIKIFPALYFSAREILPFLLLGVLAYMIYAERTPQRRAFALLVMIYSGVLGLIVLNSGILSPRYALFPALTGLFGISTLLTSLRTQPKIPEQEITYSEVGIKNGVVMGSIGGIATGLLPSIGSSQSALIIQNILKGKDEKEFLIALGGVNTSDAIYALLALYLIGNPRSGASIAIEQMIMDFTLYDFIFMISVILITLFFATFITLELARFSVRRVQSIDYKLFSKATLIFLIALILLLTGLTGLLIAITATAIGSITHLTGIKRSQCMAVLIIPTILYFL